MVVSCGGKVAVLDDIDGKKARFAALAERVTLRV